MGQLEKGRGVLLVVGMVWGDTMVEAVDVVGHAVG